MFCYNYSEPNIGSICLDCCSETFLIKQIMINYIQDDLFKHVLVENERVFVPHICNDVKAWGAGFVIPLGRHYPEAKKAYHETVSVNSLMKLGHTGYATCTHAEYRKRNNIQAVEGDKGSVIIANMIAQKGTGFKDGVPPIRYDALKACMEDVKATVLQSPVKSRICCPAFGSGLAGGDWNIIEKMIEEIWKDIPVYVYVI